MGSLEAILKEYKRTNTQLGLTIYQKLISQVKLNCNLMMMFLVVNVDRQCHWTFT